MYRIVKLNIHCIKDLRFIFVNIYRVNKAVLSNLREYYIIIKLQTLISRPASRPFPETNITLNLQLASFNFLTT